MGGRYSDEWHRLHLLKPQDLVPESNMPGFPWLEERTIVSAQTPVKMQRLRAIGVPYTDEQVAAAAGEVEGKTEMDALIAYLQSLGTAVKRR